MMFDEYSRKTDIRFQNAFKSVALYNWKDLYQVCTDYHTGTCQQ